ncbi:MAG: hypothetical protein WC861_04785 [Candidatus Micrarchaeia archaeon]
MASQCSGGKAPPGAARASKVRTGREARLEAMLAARGRMCRKAPPGAARAPGLRDGARGQSSLEALFAFAALLCALAVLAHAAKAQSDAFAAAVGQADERTLLAREAFYIDMSASTMPTAALQRSLSGVPGEGGKWLASNSSGAIREPLFHKISADADGRYHVQSG